MSFCRCAMPLKTFGFDNDGATEMSRSNLAESNAAIHLHFGYHDSLSSNPRIVDSWRSGKAVVQYLTARVPADLVDPYMVEDGANGLVATTVQAAMQCARLLRRDLILQKVLTEVGRTTSSRPTAEWNAVVDALLTDA